LGAEGAGEGVDGRFAVGLVDEAPPDPAGEGLGRAVAAHVDAAARARAAELEAPGDLALGRVVAAEHLAVRRGPGARAHEPVERGERRVERPEALLGDLRAEA